MPLTPSIEAADLGPDHLVLSYFSLGTQPFDVRCAAAGAAGFDAIGLLHRDYVSLVHEQGRSAKDLIDAAAEHGLRVVEVEAAQGWSAATPPDSHRGRVDQCLEMAEAFGARHIMAVGTFSGTLEDAVTGFGDLCDRAADHGASVGLEPIPGYEVCDIATAREIVERSGRPNAGLCIDTWHLERGGYWEQLEALPGELVTSIQLNDGPLEPEHDDYIEDCIWNRRLCGEGEFDIDRFVQTLDLIGSSAPYSVEIISTRLQQEDPFVVARQIADTSRRAIADARAAFGN